MFQSVQILLWFCAVNKVWAAKKSCIGAVHYKQVANLQLPATCSGQLSLLPSADGETGTKIPFL